MFEDGTTLEVLRGAKRLIEDPERWSGDGPGDGCPRRCAVHALHAAGATAEVKLAGLDELAAAMGVKLGYVASFNDSHSHAEVLAAFDKAIANVEARQREAMLDVAAQAQEFCVDGERAFGERTLA
ncbi:MAG: hypothetical protein QOJ29_3508 [Thermoleophilaceae bacterium]|nr:hypothetical protein [Thermoleophilaceae bacterium]